MRHARAFGACLGLLVAVTPASGQQTRQQSGPQPPGGRLVSTSQDCTRLQQEWDAYKEQWGQQHQACLDSHNNNNNVQKGPTCSRAPCQQLHYLVYEYASSEASRMNDECRAAVREIDRQKQEIARQQAEYEAAVRRYNQQIAEQNRRILEAINRENAQIAEQNRLAQQAVEQRNRAAQQVFQDLMRQYNRPTRMTDGTTATLQDMREALRGFSSQLSNRVSDLVDELGAVTFDDALNGLAEASSAFGTAFDVTHATHGLEPPERVTSVLESVDRWTSAWDVFLAGRTSLSNTATPQERFDSQISGLSASTTFLFQRTPWAASIVSENIEGIGRWANSSWRVFEDSLNGTIATDDQIRDTFARAMFPRMMWLNDRINHLQGTRDQLHRFFGR